MNALRVLLFVTTCLLGSQLLYAQPSVDNQKPLVLDSKEDFKDAIWAPRGPKRKTINYIYKYDQKNVLFGNPCAVKVTRKMGFEYVLQPKGVPGSPGKGKALWNNFLVKTKLVFTRSPFWKLILNKRQKDCRTRSGDIVG